ncbi:ribonuclease 3 [Lactococcus hodotermopsidis]|uniref:Ribonuclease 3 n=1 Tax=Pseudolactococcus hodotermopsidis TaxID=2709157 RepID=A0A6A0BCE3_9LACT|nr:ribonuclease III [Lactococcus hodotermopsidis]GFH42028.1 ribonuclease 3 [Lactococcus hodotermopsidis]
METLQEKLRDYKINFKNLALLDEAFTHKSYYFEHKDSSVFHNERLEFLGDAVLGFVIVEYLYKAFPDEREGVLTEKKISIVRRESLADFSRKLGFDAYLKLGNGEEKNGGRKNDANMENLFEAFLGALLVDQGMFEVKKFLYKVMIPEIENGSYDKVTDYKSALQEIFYSAGTIDDNNKIPLAYVVIGQSGPVHEPIFEIDVVFEGRTIGHGKGKSKKIAEQDAARDAFQNQQKDSKSCI